MPKRASLVIASVVTAVIATASSGPLMAGDSVTLAWHQYYYTCATMVGQSKDVGALANGINALKEDAHTHQCYDPEYADKKCDDILARIQFFTEQAEYSLQSWRDWVPKCEEARRNYLNVLLDNITNVLLSPRPEVAVRPPTEPQIETGIEIPPTSDQPNAEDGSNWVGRWALESTNPKVRHNAGRGRLYTVKQTITIVNEVSGTFVDVPHAGRVRATIVGNTISFQFISGNKTPARVSLTMNGGICSGTLVSQGSKGTLHWKTVCRRL